MSASMVFLATVASESGVRHRRISLALVPRLVDNHRYFLPGDLPPAAGEELRDVPAQDRPDRPAGQTVTAAWAAPAQPARAGRAARPVARARLRLSYLINDHQSTNSMPVIETEITSAV